MQIYKVGGVVRDKLLGRVSQDQDWVVVGATPAQMLALGYTQVGKGFPVFLHPITHEEYALARIERKTQAGYTGFAVHADLQVTLEDDLRRRDLTINALAEDEHGTIIDPFNGRADLQAGILRHVSPAFVEDPVRVLRVARFAARFDFQVAPETVALMRDMVENGEVDALIPERVWQETERALCEPQPQRFIEVLHQCGALARIFPEIACLFGIPQPPHHHPEVDTGHHLLLCLQQARKMTADSQILFAVLTHDLGKGTTPTDILPHHHGHEERGVDLIQALCRRYRVPNSHRELALLVARFHSYCHHLTELNPKTILKALQALDALRRPQRFRQFLIACEADARGRRGLTERIYPQAELFWQVLETVQRVEVQPLLDAGFEGAKLANELHHRRLQALIQLFAHRE